MMFVRTDQLINFFSSDRNVKPGRRAMVDMMLCAVLGASGACYLLNSAGLQLDLEGGFIALWISFLPFFCITVILAGGMFGVARVLIFEKIKEEARGNFTWPSGALATVSTPIFSGAAQNCPGGPRRPPKSFN